MCCFFRALIFPVPGKIVPYFSLTVSASIASLVKDREELSGVFKVESPEPEKYLATQGPSSESHFQVSVETLPRSTEGRSSVSTTQPISQNSVSTTQLISRNSTSDSVHTVTTRGHDSTELEVVEQNIHKCLSATELSDYFDTMHFTNTAITNAGSLLSLMRSVIPTRFTATHKNALCWNAKFDASLSRSSEVEGHIDRFSFKKPRNSLAHLVMSSHFRAGVSSSEICIPSLFVLGFPKCGSTYIYCLIREMYKYKEGKSLVPQIEKEPHMWVASGPTEHVLRPLNHDDVGQYFLNFMPRPDQAYLPIDASPNHIFQWPHNSEKETLENYCMLPAVLPTILPNNKYIVILRDPVTMLYSAYWFCTSSFCPYLNRATLEKGPSDFHDKAVKKINIYKECILKKPIDACMEDLYVHVTGLVHYKVPRCGRVRFEVGFYYHYIRRWLAVIPREQFFFLTIEELHSNFNEVTQRLSDFLGFNMVINEQGFGEHRMNGRCKNTQSVYNYRTDSALRMREDTKELLYEFFDPFNQKLAELLQDSKYRWKPE